MSSLLHEITSVPLTGNVLVNSLLAFPLEYTLVGLLGTISETCTLLDQNFIRQFSEFLFVSGVQVGHG